MCGVGVMEDVLMGWTSSQWRIVERDLGRRPGSLNMYYANSMDYSRFVDAQAEWKSMFNFEPGKHPLTKTESKPVSNQRINFGFECKIISKGWVDDPMTIGRVFELRVRVGDALFGSRQVMSPHNFMYARDTQFAEHVERKAIENIKREIVDTLFPNL